MKQKKPVPRNTVGGRLYTLYVRSGLSFEEFAKIGGVSRAAMLNYTNNERKPDSDLIIKICNHFSVSAHWLMGLTDTETISADIQNAVAVMGISENAVNSIIALSKEEEYFKDVLSRAIESNRFRNVVYQLYYFIANIDSLEESDFHKEKGEIYMDEKKITMDKVEAVEYLKQCVKDAVGSLCNNLYIQRFQEIKFDKAPAKFRPVAADELIYLPAKDEK